MNRSSRNKRSILVLAFLMMQGLWGYAQDYQWWNEKHDWDGATPWFDYIITSPGYMGPNALPVPAIKNGTIAPHADLQFSLETHRSKGDKTENLHTALYTPLFTNRVGLKVGVVPVEHYRMDTLTRDRRRARNETGEGYAGGDFYIGTHIQLIEDKEKLPDVMLTLNLKTASGTKLSGARYTDAPGYFFDLSFGKKIPLNSPKVDFIRPHAMFGMYVWQLHGHDHFQNDALLYGAGFDLDLQKVAIVNSWGGYYGYIGNGDRPMVYRLKVKSTLDKLLNYELTLQQGLHDYPYTSVRLSCNANLTRIKKNMFQGEDLGN